MAHARFHCRRLVARFAIRTAAALTQQLLLKQNVERLTAGPMRTDKARRALRRSRAVLPAAPAAVVPTAPTTG
jgi:hypothetical protein